MLRVKRTYAGTKMLPTFRDVETAAKRLEGHAVRTPVIEAPRLNEIAGGRVLVKAECLQRTGSFKFRGAWNRISQLDAASSPGGVVAFSSGNHAQGVAAAAPVARLVGTEELFFSYSGLKTQAVNALEKLEAGGARVHHLLVQFRSTSCDESPMTKSRA